MNTWTMCAKQTLSCRSLWLGILAVTIMLLFQNNLFSSMDKNLHQGSPEIGVVRNRRAVTDVCDSVFPAEYFYGNVTGATPSHCWSLLPMNQDCRLLFDLREKTQASPSRDLSQNHRFCSTGNIDDCLLELKDKGSEANCIGVSSRAEEHLDIAGSSDHVYQTLKSILQRGILDSGNETQGLGHVIKCTTPNTTFHLFSNNATNGQSSEIGNEGDKEDTEDVEKIRGINVFIIRDVSRAHFYTQWTQTVAVLRDLSLDKKDYVSHFMGLQTKSLSWIQTLTDLLREKQLNLGHKDKKGQRASDYHNSPGTSLLDLARLLGYEVYLHSNYCPRPGSNSLIDSLDQTHSNISAGKQLPLISFPFNALECHGELNSHSRGEKQFGSYTHHDYLHDLTGRLFEYMESLTNKASRGAYNILQISEIVCPSMRTYYSCDAWLAAYLLKLDKQDGSTMTMVVGDKGRLMSALAQQSAFWHTDQFNPPFLLHLPHILHRHVLQMKGGLILLEAIHHMETSLISHHNLSHLIVSLLCLLHSPTHQGWEPSDNVTTCEDSLNWLSHRIQGGDETKHLAEETKCCDDVSLEPPVVCLCHCDHRPADVTPVTFESNDTIEVAMAEFALGALNNRVQDYLQRSIDMDNQRPYINTFGHIFRGMVCPRLKGKMFKHLRTSLLAQNKLIIELTVTVDTMVLTTKPTKVIHEPQYHIYLERTFHNDSLQLLWFRRLNRTKDRDNACGIESSLQDLCFCVPEKHQTLAYIWTSSMDASTLPSVHFGMPSKVNDIHDGCLYLLQRQYQRHTHVFEAANVCNDRSYDVELKVYVRHMVLSSSSNQVDAHVPELSRYFLLSAWQNVYANVKSALYYNVQFTFKSRYP